MEDITATVRQTLKENQPTLEQMYTHVTREKTSNPNLVDEMVTEEYGGCDVRIQILVRYTGEPHKMAVRQGCFSIDIVVNVEDTSILTDLKSSLYDAHDRILPNISSFVTQDYQSGTLKITEDVKADEFRDWFLD